MSAASTSRLTQLFDIRNVIGALLAIYGVVLTIAGSPPACCGSGTRAHATIPSISTSAPKPTGGWDWP